MRYRHEQLLHHLRAGPLSSRGEVVSGGALWGGAGEAEEGGKGFVEDEMGRGNERDGSGVEAASSGYVSLMMRGATSCRLPEGAEAWPQMNM